jgi:hypothetical protein
MTIDQEVIIEKGLQPGQRVVTEGQLRLAPGSLVQIKDAEEGKVQPQSEEATP